MAKRGRGGAGFITPVAVLFLYAAGSLALICAFRYFVPGRIEPLEYYALTWRLGTGLVDFITLFPAIALSALVIPFGLKEHPGGGYAGSTFVGDRGFSPRFLRYITWPVISAACAAAVYALLFFLVLPLTLDSRAAMEERAELYQQAKAKAERLAAEKNWAETSEFLEICDALWPHSPEIERLRKGIAESPAAPQTPPDEPRGAGTDPVWLGLPGDPVNSADALALAREAFDNERYYDAHWLAVLAERLARPGAAEISAARSAASRAWDKIAALAPNAREQERFRLYRLKRDGYEAMLAGDWISAYYTFQELLAVSPDSFPRDPDVEHYFEASKRGVASLAFFIDELDLALGSVQTGPVFSFPLAENNGRLVLRFGSMTALPHHSYAWNAEFLAADSSGALLYKASTPYCKIIPLSEPPEMNPDAPFREGEAADTPAGDAPVEKTVLLLRSLDRGDQERRFDPVWSGGYAAEFSDLPPGGTRITLDISYEDFLLLSRLKRGAGALHLGELLRAEQEFGKYGHLPEVFRAELFRRLGECTFFLPMTVLALLLGWRFRPRKKPRYVYVPMLGILPLVFYGAALFFRIIINNVSIWLALSTGFTTALICLVTGAAAAFIAALALLAAQHG